MSPYLLRASQDGLAGRDGLTPAEDRAPGDGTRPTPAGLVTHSGDAISALHS